MKLTKRRPDYYNPNGIGVVSQWEILLDGEHVADVYRANYGWAWAVLNTPYRSSAYAEPRTFDEALARVRRVINSMQAFKERYAQPVEHTT